MMMLVTMVKEMSTFNWETQVKWVETTQRDKNNGCEGVRANDVKARQSASNMKIFRKFNGYECREYIGVIVFFFFICVCLTPSLSLSLCMCGGKTWVSFSFCAHNFHLNWNVAQHDQIQVRFKYELNNSVPLLFRTFWTMHFFCSCWKISFRHRRHCPFLYKSESPNIFQISFHLCLFSNTLIHLH